ncbi:unnamed protein product, partial [Prunus brigantina]
RNQASKRVKTIYSFFKKKVEGDKLDIEKTSTFNDKASPSIEPLHHTSPLVELNEFDVASLERDLVKCIQICDTLLINVMRFNVLISKLDLTNHTFQNIRGLSLERNIVDFNILGSSNFHG